MEHELLEWRAEAVAEFLYKEEGLNKTAIGNFLGDRCSAAEMFPHILTSALSPVLVLNECDVTDSSCTVVLCGHCTQQQLHRRILGHIFEAVARHVKSRGLRP